MLQNYPLLGDFHSEGKVQLNYCTFKQQLTFDGNSISLETVYVEKVYILNSLLINYISFDYLVKNGFFIADFDIICSNKYYLGQMNSCCSSLIVVCNIRRMPCFPQETELRQ